MVPFLRTVCAGGVEPVFDGLGVGLMPSWLFDDAIAEGRVVRLLADWQVPALPIRALYPAKRLLPRRAAVFMDFLSTAFAADATLQVQPMHAAGN